MSFDFLKLFMTDASRFGRRQDALAPLKWPCSTVSVACLYLAAKTDDGWARGSFFLFAFGVMGLLAFAYLYLLIKDPDRLQSED